MKRIASGFSAMLSQSVSTSSAHMGDSLSTFGSVSISQSESVLLRLKSTCRSVRTSKRSPAPSPASTLRTMPAPTSDWNIVHAICPWRRFSFGPACALLMSLRIARQPSCNLPGRCSIASTIACVTRKRDVSGSGRLVRSLSKVARSQCA